MLLRSESAASSNIENLTASARAVAEAEALGSTGRRNAVLIVSNTEAMKAAVALADQIDEKAILRRCDCSAELAERGEPLAPVRRAIRGVSIRIQK